MIMLVIGFYSSYEWANFLSDAMQTQMQFAPSSQRIEVPSQLGILLQDSS